MHAAVASGAPPITVSPGAQLNMRFQILEYIEIFQEVDGGEEGLARNYNELLGFY